MARILLAEDERHIGDMVTFRLTNGGHQVVRAHDGEEALRLAAAEAPDLVILDVMMPVLDGFQVLRQLKADPALAAIPVIMLTAKGRESDVLAGLSGGAVDYVVKPFSLKELTARIEAVLRRAGP
jgi:DNA-binding response OmpR family regulator